MNRIKQQAPTIVFKADDLHVFQIQVANGLLEKPVWTTTLEFDTRGNTCAEHFVKMKNLTGLFISVHFARQNSIVIDTTYGIIEFL